MNPPPFGGPQYKPSKKGFILWPALPVGFCEEFWRLAQIGRAWRPQKKRFWTSKPLVGQNTAMDMEMCIRARATFSMTAQKLQACHLRILTEKW